VQRDKNKIRIEKSMEKKPNTLIVGAPRCGTTKLYKVLKSHPNVYMSSVKEPGYFCPKGMYRSWKSYLELFEGADEEKVIGEASTGYLHGSSPSEINDKIGEAKIIISIRNPIERSKSHYRYKRKNGKIKIGFERFIAKEIKNFKSDKRTDDVLKCSFYGRSISKYMDVFGKRRVKVVLFEDFVRKLESVTCDLCSFLGISEDKLNLTKEAVNVGKKPLFPLLNKILADDFAGKKIIKELIPEKRRRKISKMIKKVNVSNENYNIVIDKETKQKMIDVFKEDMRGIGEKTCVNLSKWSDLYR